MTILSLLYQFVAVLPATVAAVASLVAALKNSKKIGEIHVDLNGRLTALLENTKVSAHAEGRLQERKEIAAGTSPTVNVTPKE